MYGYVAFFGDFDALLIGILYESPEKYAIAGGASVIEAVGTALLLKFCIR